MMVLQSRRDTWRLAWMQLPIMLHVYSQRFQIRAKFPPYLNFESLVENRLQPFFKRYSWSLNCILTLITLIQSNHPHLVEYHLLVKKQLYI